MLNSFHLCVAENAIDELCQGLNRVCLVAKLINLLQRVEVLDQSNRRREPPEQASFYDESLQLSHEAPLTLHEMLNIVIPRL